ncbi:hypothetical protein [Pseudarthrobacter siccitolerans]
MSATSSEETVVRVSTVNHEPINLSLEAGRPVMVRIEVESNCSCHSGYRSGPGSYTDTDLGTGR